MTRVFGAARTIYALAARSNRTVTVLLWNYHDDDVAAPVANVALTVEGVSASRASVTHYRVDGEHGNSYEAWKKMGSPQQPTPQQYAELEKAGKLKALGAPERVTIERGQFARTFALPRQAVSLIKIDY